MHRSEIIGASSERRVCVVSGSSSGIGVATVRRYAREGWDAVVNCSRQPGPAEAVALECRGLGAQALVVRANVAADADCRRLGAEVEAHFGRADVLVNNAGTTLFVAMKNLEGLRVCRRIDLRCQSGRGNTRLGQPDPRERGPAGPVMVCHEAARALVPGMSSLDNPRLGLHDKAFGDDLGPQGLLCVFAGAADRAWPRTRPRPPSG